MILMGMNAMVGTQCPFAHSFPRLDAPLDDAPGHRRRRSRGRLQPHARLLTEGAPITPHPMLNTLPHYAG